MYYRIAEITVDSDVYLPSYSAFACEAAKADVKLSWRRDLPPGGTDMDAGTLKVRRLPDGWFIHPEERDDLGLITNKEYTELCLIMGDPAAETGKQTEWLVRSALECLLIRRGYISLHAAAVALDGEAYAFSGPSGMGKSTRADAWIEAFGAQLISGDRPLVNVSTMELCGVPWDGKEKCFLNARYPLKMVCEVRRSGTAYARAMSFEQRCSLLSQQSFVPMWDTDTSTMQMMNLMAFAKAAPIVRIFCGPLPDDAKAMREILEKNELKREQADMKAKSGFVLRNVVGEHLLMPVGDNIGQFEGTVVLNDVAAFVWEKLQNPVSRDDLLTAVLNEYNVDEASAARDLDTLLDTLKSYDVIEGD